MFRKVSFPLVLVDGRIVTPDPAVYVTPDPVPNMVPDPDNPGEWVQDGTVQPPDELVSTHWAGTWQLDDNTMVGLYKGNDPGVTDYAGEVPPLEVLTTFNSKQLLAAILHLTTSDQAIAALTQPAIAAQLRLLEIRTRTIQVTDAGYISAIGGLHAAGALTDDQRDACLNGLRADWLGD